MSKGRPDSPVPAFWQTLVSVLLGIAAGLSLLIFATRPNAEALSHSATSDAHLLSSQESGSQGKGIFASVPRLPELERPMTLLVMGVDSNGQNTERWTGTRSDTMMLVNVDPIRQRLGIVSIPRDSRVRIPHHGVEKVNAAHALGGPELAVETIRQVFGIHIDRYVVIDTQGLKEAFAVLGPVEVLVENRMHYRDRAARLTVDLEPGLQRLTPEQAEEYVRFRHDARGDLGRIERQQWFLRQLTGKLKEPQILFKVPQLLSLANEYVKTDLSLEEMAALFCFAKGTTPSQVETAMLPGDSATIHGGSYWLPDPEGSRLVIERLVGPTIPGTLEPRYLAVEEPGEAEGYPDEMAASPAPRPSSWRYHFDPDRPLSVAIKYPRGADEAAKMLQSELERAGYKVRYRWQVPASECQHEQIVQMSCRADQYRAGTLKDALPEIRGWPVVVALEPRPAADFTLVISPWSPLVTASAASSANGRHLDPSPVE